MSKMTNDLSLAAQEREQRQTEQWNEVRRWEANLTTRAPAAPDAPAPAQAPKATADAWQQAFDKCQAQMLELERLVSASQLRLDTVQGQVASKTQALAQMQRELDAARQDATAASADRAAAAQRLQVVSRRLEALRECQHLAQALRMSEEQLHGARQMTDRLAEAHAKLADEMAASRKRSEDLQTLVDQSRSRLGQALTRAQEPS